MIPQKFGARRLFDLGGGEHKTPFLVERFVKSGIEVWNTKEGQQRFHTCIDKLLNS